MAGNEPRYVIEVYRGDDEDLFFRMGIEDGDRASKIAAMITALSYSEPEFKVVVIDTQEGTILR